LPYDLTLTEIKDLNKIVNTKYNSLNEGYNWKMKYNNKTTCSLYVWVYINISCKYKPPTDTMFPWIEMIHLR
jgi:hypothetical protein